MDLHYGIIQVHQVKLQNFFFFKSSQKVGNRNDLKKKRKREGIILAVGFTIALFGLILMCIPPAAGILPYSFTCCDHFARTGESQRCIGNSKCHQKKIILNFKVVLVSMEPISIINVFLIKKQNS